MGAGLSFYLPKPQVFDMPGIGRPEFSRVG